MSQEVICEHDRATDKDGVEVICEHDRATDKDGVEAILVSVSWASSSLTISICFGSAASFS